MNDFKVSMARFEEDPKRTRESLATATTFLKIAKFPIDCAWHEIVSLEFLIYLMRLVARANRTIAERPDDSIVPQLTDAACKNRPEVEQ